MTPKNGRVDCSVLFGKVKQKTKVGLTGGAAARLWHFFRRDLPGAAICHSVFRASASLKPQFFEEIAQKCHSKMAAPADGLTGGGRLKSW